MLYPVYVLGWTRIARWLGFGLSDPKGFLRLVQAMDSLLAAGCCAILFAWVRSLTDSLKLALMAALFWALSHAVLLHATNASEPLAGLFISLCALSMALLSIRQARASLMIPAGFLIALAMASYQSMVFIGMACGFLGLLWPIETTSGDRIKRALALTISFFVSLGLIYSLCYWLQGIRGIAEAKEAFIAIRAGEAYGGFGLAKLLNLPIGLTHAIVIAIPHDYEGLRWLLKHPDGWLLRAPVSVLILTSVAVWAIGRKRSPSAPEWLNAFTIACCSALVLDLLLLLYWDPLYDKLWLQPLWLSLLLSFTRSAYSVPPSTIAKRALWLMLIVCPAINLWAAVGSARGSWPNFDEATRVNVVVSPVDYTITEWNSVALLYRQIWAGDARSFDFPAATCARISAGLREMEEGIAATRARGGQVYFLGTLDLDRSAWDSFLGGRCRVPYETLQPYRDRARTIATFQSDGRIITLKRLDP